MDRKSFWHYLSVNLKVVGGLMLFIVVVLLPAWVLPCGDLGVGNCLIGTMLWWMFIGVLLKSYNDWDECGGDE